MLYSLRTTSATAQEGVVLDNELIAKHSGLNDLRFEIIEACLYIEHQLITFISKYLFPERSEKSDFFNSNIIRSDLITFSGKKRLVLEIINKENLLNGPEKDEFGKLISRILKYRNAFTHGRIIELLTGEVLEYYEGGKRIKELDESYFKKIDNDFRLYYKIWDKIFFNGD